LESIPVFSASLLDVAIHGGAPPDDGGFVGQWDVGMDGESGRIEDGEEVDVGSKSIGMGNEVDVEMSKVREGYVLG
jgi:hypothetical protein